VDRVNASSYLLIAPGVAVYQAWQFARIIYSCTVAVAIRNALHAGLPSTKRHLASGNESLHEHRGCLHTYLVLLFPAQILT
jgi:hypothetical protein